MMDLQKFGYWSGSLSDEEFAKAFAGLGVLTAAYRSNKKLVVYLLSQLTRVSEPDLPHFMSHLFAVLPQPAGGLGWEFPQHPESAWPKAEIMARAWTDFIASRWPRTRLVVLKRGADLALRFSCARILRAPVVEASILIEAAAFEPIEARPWKPRLTIATFPEDFLADAFKSFGGDPAGVFRVCTEGEDGGDIVALSAPWARGGDWPSRPPQCHLLLLFVTAGSPYNLPSWLWNEEKSFSGDFIAVIGCNVEVEGGQQVRDGLLRLTTEWYGHDVDLALDYAFPGADVLMVTRRRLPPLQSELTRRLSRAAAGLQFRPGIDLLIPDTMPSDVAWDAEKMELDLDRQFEDREEHIRANLDIVRPEVDLWQVAPPLAPRFIQHRLLRRAEDLEEVQHLEIGSEVTLAVRIGPDESWWHSASEEFPIDDLPRKNAFHRLQVVFHEPDQLHQPLVSEVLLPGEGASNTAEFAFTPRVAARFQGRIAVLHRGRIVQTVLIVGEVVDAGSQGRVPLKTKLEAPVRWDFSRLSSRRSFDAAFVLNHTAADRPMLTAISSKFAVARDLTGIEAPVATINQELSNVALSVADYSGGLFTPANEQLLVRLARSGAMIYSHLFLDNLKPTEKGGLNLENLEYIQIVSARADAVVPMEFMYQYPQPNAAAKVCPQALDALKDGKCTEGCYRQKDPLNYVCPLGFWGLSKVIERHVYNPNLEVKAFLTVQAEPMSRRSRLSLEGGAVIGYSKEVPDEKVASLVAMLKSQYNSRAAVAGNWEGWRAAVNATQPSLLVALPHNEGMEEDIKLEIHNDFLCTEILSHAPDYVRVEGTPFPLVILLGCDTSGTAQQYASHVGCFRRAGAAAVVSTIATVFGAHAAVVGEKLVKRLLDPDRTQATRLGELLRQVKCEALRESLPMALCIVSFGDADWQL